MTITGCSDANRANFFLDSCNGDVSAAVLNFFEAGGNEAAIPEAAPAEESQPPSQEASQEARLGTVNIQSRGGEDKREFYVGGESSGLGVIKKESKDDPEDYVNDVFKRAKESGAATGERQREKEERFIGSGYKLGGDGIESSVIQGKAARQQPKDLVIRMWKTGFTVDDEPLRRYDDPENKTFMDQITKGELPDELRHLGREVNVEMENHQEEEYAPPKQEFKSFGGTANRLGAGPSTSAAAPTPVAVPAATPKLNVDGTQPTTKLRIRTCTGTQLVQEFNQSQTISDLRNFCAAYSGGKDFELRTGFPPKPITSPNSQSLKDAKLLNETVIQRLL